ncbi:MAG: hypothetical protein ACFCVC_05785 [Acidimicrobiia bacterium]
MRSLPRVVRALFVFVAVVFSVGALGLAFIFGDCAGWKGTGTCPRDPLWDWEVFRLGFAAGVAPVSAVRSRKGRLMRATVEAVAGGVLLGAVVVLITGW